jgi:HAD superfamily hydrolase (TIGR01490 family)
MQHIAIYDMDKTITARATWTGFLIQSARVHAPWRLALLPAAMLAGGAYLAKAIDRAQLKQVTQRLLLGRSLSPAAVTALAGRFADTIVDRGVLEKAVAQIAADRAAGNRLVLATASYRFYAAEIGQRLGFDDVIATGSTIDPSGGLVPRIAGENCYGPVKLRMIETWMAEQGIARPDARIRFYSDHVSDAPVLDWADEAFAVNAHPPLAALAKAKGWQSLDWR